MEIRLLNRELAFHVYIIAIQMIYLCFLYNISGLLEKSGGLFGPSDLQILIQAFVCPNIESFVRKSYMEGQGNATIK